ncbi:hypothetical protein ANN_20210 [Periplaneta americana]|uniref:Uncharacterized protein n=1 Tax=Periplaneta americana TaxID=6978 RepID=A0ABQ8SCR0_PERAM|nr:hypothetical protein ANN_20210 [Periplaneta americana]
MQLFRPGSVGSKVGVVLEFTSQAAALAEFVISRDGATSHTARISMDAVNALFPGRVISRKGDIAWPPRSPDLTVCDFFLWGDLRTKVFGGIPPRTIPALIECIRQEVGAIPANMLRGVIKQFVARVEECVRFNESHLADNIAPGIKTVTKSNLSVLGSPIFLDSVDEIATQKLELLKTLFGRLEHFHPQNPAIQKAWDEIIAGQILDSLISSFTSDKDIARIKALQEKESGSWLHALPSSCVGTLMDGKSFQIATALRLGCKICHVHQCICGETADSFGHHALSCARSKGRLPRHSAINNIISRSLTSCDIPTLLEPSGISRSDGKRPDGLTLIPWSKGKSLIWDFTCVDTSALSHLKSSVNCAGSAAESAYHAKRRKYEHLTSNYIFVAFAVETFGPWCRDAKDLMTQIGTRLLSRTGDPRCINFLRQRIGIAVQRGNAASILGSRRDLSHLMCSIPA